MRSSLIIGSRIRNLLAPLDSRKDKGSGLQMLTASKQNKKRTNTLTWIQQLMQCLPWWLMVATFVETDKIRVWALQDIHFFFVYWKAAVIDLLALRRPIFTDFLALYLFIYLFFSSPPTPEEHSFSFIAFTSKTLNLSVCCRVVLGR